MSATGSSRTGFDTWRSLLRATLPLLDELVRRGFRAPEWTLGGGTVLMLLRQHRLSRDIDIFLGDPQYLPGLSPRVDDRAAALTTDYAETANTLKLVVPDGSIDFIVAPNLTGLPAAHFRFEDRDVLLDASAEILAKKLFYHAEALRLRDVLDLAVVLDREPSAADPLRTVVHGKFAAPLATSRRRAAAHSRSRDARARGADAAVAIAVGAAGEGRAAVPVAAARAAEVRRARGRRAAGQGGAPPGRAVAGEARAARVPRAAGDALRPRSARTVRARRRDLDADGFRRAIRVGRAHRRRRRAGAAHDDPGQQAVRHRGRAVRIVPALLARARRIGVRPRVARAGLPRELRRVAPVADVCRVRAVHRVGSVAVAPVRDVGRVDRVDPMVRVRDVRRLAHVGRVAVVVPGGAAAEAPREDHRGCDEQDSGSSVAHASGSWPHCRCAASRPDGLAPLTPASTAPHRRAATRRHHGRAVLTSTPAAVSQRNPSSSTVESRTPSPES
ncbi:MAG: nucleotidyl transferase AbiEii/AbiGii toxin family protein [Deltaproteobacteria bacterium]|nr:nucleotidyl transferase AbiEii/AbiGii toxin family protein [Deltaproteobacteria bacterium]